MQIVDQVPIKGRLRVMCFTGEVPIRVNGKLRYDPTKTKLVHSFCGRNRVVDQGRGIVNAVMNGDIPADPIAKIALGDGGYGAGVPNPDADPEEASAANTVLISKKFIKPITSIERLPTSTKFVCEFNSNEPSENMSVTEFGLFTASEKLFARRTTRPMPKQVGSVHFIVEWTIQF